MIRTSDLTFAKNVLGSWSKILQDGKSPDDPHAYNYEYQTPQYQEGEIASVVAYIFDFFNDPNAGDYYLALICFYEKVGHEYRHKVLYRYCYRPEDLDEFKKMVGDFASDQQMRLNQAMQFELDEDDPVPDREDSYDQILQELNSGRIASRRKAHDYYQSELDFDDIKWYELEPGYDFDDEEIDGERAVRGWQPDVDVDAASLGTVYQLEDGRFEAVGNDEFTRFEVLGYFDNIEEAKQAVIESMEADGWLPEYGDVADKPSKHTGPLPTRKNSSVRKYADDRQKRITNRAIAGKHSGDSDVSIYMKKLKNCLAGYWDDVQYLEDYYDGENTHEEIIFLDDENGDTHSVELEFEYEDIEDGDPCFLVCPFEEYMWAFEVDSTLDPLMDARSITKALNDEIRSLN